MVYFTESLYNPTQRVLKYRCSTVEIYQERNYFDIKVEGEIDSFKADVVYVIDKDDKRIYTRKQISNPFEGIYYYKDGEERYIYLGEKYENFAYYGKDGNLVEATEKSISVEEIKPFNTNSTCVAIYLKQNVSSYMEIEVDG